jgi:hypothetical protein
VDGYLAKHLNFSESRHIKVNFEEDKSHLKRRSLNFNDYCTSNPEYSAEGSFKLPRVMVLSRRSRQSPRHLLKIVYFPPY